MFRFKLSTTARLTLGLTSVTALAVMLSFTLGLFPNTRQTIVQSRAAFCESLAIHFSLLATKGETPLMETSLRAIAARNLEIRSVAVRKATGELQLQVGDHAANWKATADGSSTDSQMYVPIMSGNEPWGTVEVCFQPFASGWFGFVMEPVYRVLAFVTLTGALGFFLFLKRTLTLLNPSKVIPGRVRSALDTLTQGLVITDNHDRIVLANQSFANTLGRPADSLVGMNANLLPWREKDEITSNGKSLLRERPWTTAFKTSAPLTGTLLDLQINHESRRTFVVNAAPVFNDKHVCQGVLASLEDVTPLEQKKHELHLVIDKLHKSTDQVRQQNKELERLATTDPLTGCLNRRAFFARFESLWDKAERHSLPISCVMVDIDFFKSVNDEHGHPMGDEVLKGVAALLRNNAGPTDFVARFGGEEFCILMFNQTLEDAAIVAEGLRLGIQGCQFEKVSVTASLGCATRTSQTISPQQMLEEADKSLYFAKRNGRNQVVRWDQVPADIEIDDKNVSRTRATKAAVSGLEDDTNSLPYPAVAALLSALAFRHRPTAEHCRRVADSAVQLAQKRMPFRECYVMEIAALLHDIGKVGVPDQILLKNSPLDREEWEVMRRHDQIGLEIVNAAFSSAQLSQILEHRTSHFGGSIHAPHRPVGEAIPLGSRILAIADAYDSMTHDSPYRPAMSNEQAWAELKHCAGSQFDPELTEEFIQLQKSPTNKNLPARVSVNKKAAVNIGAQIERLVTAIDDRNLAGLKILAQRLEQTAAMCGAPDIAAKAKELHQAVVDDRDLMIVLVEACELVNLCRSTQDTILAQAGVAREGTEAGTAVQQLAHSL